MDQRMVVITGASDGLGLELARLFRAADKKVVNISRRVCKYADENILVDLGKGAGVKAAVKAIERINQPLEAIINCAGVLSVQPLGNITESEVDKVLSINIKAAILFVSSLIGRIKEDGTDIVNVASTSGVKGRVDLGVYGASKWAMRGFSANLQAELKDTPCRVISFCPGAFKSELAKKATGRDTPPNEGALMQSNGVARLIKQLLDLPKIMEVSEIIINRKQKTFL